MITKRIVKNTSFYFMASMVRALISLAINPIIAMNMEHYDYALTGFYTSFISLLLPLFSLMYGQFYSRNFFKLKNDKERDQFGSDLVISRLIFNVFELGFVLLAFLIYARVQNIAFPYYPYAILSFSTILFNVVYDFYLLKLKLRREAKNFFMVSLYHALVLSASSILFVVVLQLGAMGKMISALMTSIIFAVFFLKKLLRRVRLNRALIIESLKFCWPLIIAGSLGYFLTGFDRALLVNLDDNVQLGLYNIALHIAGFFMIFQTSLGDTFQPDIFEAVAKNNKRKLIIILGGIYLLNLIPIFIFVLLAPQLISVLTAGRFTEAYTYARILSLRNLTAGMYYSLSGLIVAYGYPGIALINRILGSIISILLYRYLIASFEFYGAAWGQVLSYMCMTIVALIILFGKKRKKTLMRIRK